MPDKCPSERRDLDLVLTFFILENSYSAQLLYYQKREIFSRACLTKLGNVPAETYLA